MSNEDGIELVDNDSIVDQLSSLENKLSSLMTKLNQNNEQKFELIDRNDLKNKLHSITTSLITNNFSVIKKHLQSKCSPSIIPIQETCVRLLTLCVQHSFDLAKQISSEFNYFNETKNWLEKFLLIKKSDLREMSLEFILTYLKYVQPPFNSHDNLILIKKILLKSDSKSPLTLINCIFAHLGSDLKSSLDFLFSQLLYGVVRNQHFSKTDKIRLFSDHILSKISKLFEYEGQEDEGHQVAQMVAQFFKCLFTSTKFGISFFDKSLGLKSDKNLNHLIFNQLIALDFNKVYQIANVPELFAATLRLCPDLTQKFIKVKLKQLASDNLLFINFLTLFFHQQSKHVRSFQRFLQGNEDENFLLELIVATSIPLGVNFQKDLSEQKLDLLTASLNCVKEWKALVESEKEWSDSMRIIVEKCDCFETKLNLELLSKYLPRFDQLSKNFHLITAYIRIFQQSLNLMDLEQIEMDLSVKFEPAEAASYLEFVQCVTEIKYRNNFEMVSDRLRPVLIRNLNQLIPRSDLLAQLVDFFQLVLSSSEMVKFDADLMYLCLRKSGATAEVNGFLETLLCQRKRSIVLLDQRNEVGLDQFLALVDPNSDLVFYSGLLDANLDLDVHADRVRGIQEMVGKKVQIGEEKVKIKSCSQAFMSHLRELLDLDTVDLNVKLFNLSIRSRLLIYLLKQVLDKADGFDSEADFDVIMTNLEHNVQTVNELSKDSSLTKNQVSKLNYIMTTFLKSRTMIKGSFENETISQFVTKSVQSTNLDRATIIEPYVSEFLSSNEYESFILELDLTKSQFDAVLQKIIHKYDLNKMETKINKKFFKVFIKFLLKNKSNLIDWVGIRYLDKIGKFDGDLKNFMDAFRLIFLAIKSKDELLSDEVTDLLSDGRCFESKLFDLQLKLINDEKLTNLVTKKIQPMASNENLSLPSNINELTDEYKHTLAQNDLEIYSKLKQLDPELNCLLFSRVSKLSKSNDLEQKQAKISDFITLKIEETIITNSMRNFPIKRKLEEKCESFDSSVYDPVYMLANLYDLLDYANVVDVLQLIQSNCLAYLFSSLSSHCAKLRMLAYGSLYRFVSHLENSRVYCKNIILYLIDLLRNSLDKENQRLSSVISVFLAETVSIIVEPGHKLYKPLVSFYLLKPILDLANVPEFYKFFNSSSLEFREERKWIMNILVSGMRSSLEYRLYQKRFIYRQLLSIYESKMSDNDLKSLVLDLLVKTCESKYALIDLVKKHFFIIWLSSVLNSLVIDETKNFLFFKVLSIYNLVWTQLSTGGTDERLPLGFLNQMLALSKIIKSKLSSSGCKFEEMFKWENSENEQQRVMLEEFFKSSDCVMHEISKYEIGHRREQLSLSEIIETSERKVQNGELENYSDIVSFVVSRKRTNETCSQNVKNKKAKI